MIPFLQAATVAAVLASAAPAWVNPPLDSNSPASGAVIQFPAPTLDASQLPSYTSAKAAAPPSLSLAPVAKRDVPDTRHHQSAHLRDNHPAPSKIERGNQISTWLNRQELMRTERPLGYPPLPGSPRWYTAVYPSPWGYPPR